MNLYFYHKYQDFFAANDLLMAAALIAILAFIGLVALSKIYIYSTFDVLIKAYLGQEGDVMIRKDAAQYCCECETIFEFSEGKLGCPCCGNRAFISVNQLLKAKEEKEQSEPVFAERRDAILNRAAQFQGMLQGADGADSVSA